jgi:predicted ATPase/DNA-binding CsgD family transcriptional regulator/Tfp pilus assembly protein PilF
VARGDQTRGRHFPRIPLLPAPLIGRRTEIATARELLLGGARLLTLTGPPGVGKTALALALGIDQQDRFDDGASLVDLSPVADAGLVAEAIADVLGASGRRQPLERLIGTLQHRELLLVLDNFEQVVGAAPLVADLLAACPRLTTVVTSRVALRVRWEHELPVPPLRLPDSHDLLPATELAQVPAIRLFVERGRAVNPSFALTDENASAVASVCAHLDGLPLAIELAAARVRLLAPAAMLRQLERTGEAGVQPRALALLTDGPRDLPRRQQTLRDAIAWSHALLDPAEQILLRRLAVFAGGCTLEAAEAICNPVPGSKLKVQGEAPTLNLEPETLNLVASLIEKSLLRQEDGPAAAASGPRLRMLETVREFALEQLSASDEEAVIRRRHIAYYVGLAEVAEPRLFGPEQGRWLDHLSQERENLSAAARWATAEGDAESVLRLGAALIRFWRVRGGAADARERVEGILALASAAPPVPAAIKAFEGAGELALVLGEYAVAQRLFEQSLEVAQQLQDRLGMAKALCLLGKLAGFRGSYPDAHRLGDESLAIVEAHGDIATLTGTLREVGMLSYLSDDQPRARHLFERGLAAARQTGDQRMVANLAFSLALTHHVTGELEEAGRIYEECLATDRALGHRASEGSVLNNLGHIASLRGDLPRARVLFRDSLLASREGGDRRRLGFTLAAISALMASQGEPVRAIRLNAASLTALDAMGAQLAPPMRALYDQQLTAAHTALGPDAVGVAQAAGQTIALDQAVEETLSWLGDPGERPASDERSVGDSRPRRRGSSADTAAPLGPAEVMKRAQPGPARADQPAPAAHLPLTPRERDVAALLARGLTNRQISEALVVTEGTAENYVVRAMRRLGLQNRAQVAAWAVERHLHEEPTAR